jgi:Domain of unknown function (DUF4160)
MYFNDHNPSHFHAEYGEFEALIDIESLAILRGELSPGTGCGLGNGSARKQLESIAPLD